MNTDAFLREYHTLIATDHGEAEFASIRMLCPGLSTPKLGKLLNRAVYHMDGKEVYCEIGTFTGYTLISASLSNTSKHCVGIDNFELVGDKSTQEARNWAKSRLNINREHFKFGNHHFIESDFRNVDIKDPIGVFYIDGRHTYEEVIENFKWGHGRLSDDALIFVDDVSICRVGEAVTQWVSDHKNEYKEVFHMDTFYPENDVNHWNSVFWNGLSIVKFKREKK